MSVRNVACPEGFDPISADGSRTTFRRMGFIQIGSGAVNVVMRNLKNGDEISVEATSTSRSLFNNLVSQSYARHMVRTHRRAGTRPRTAQARVLLFLGGPPRKHSETLGECFRVFVPHPTIKTPLLLPRPPRQPPSPNRVSCSHAEPHDERMAARVIHPPHL